MPDEALTIKEVAALLKLAEKRIRRTEFERSMDDQPRGGGDDDA